jgi:hypothetical protein
MELVMRCLNSRIPLSIVAACLFAVSPLHADGFPTASNSELTPATWIFRGCIADKSCHIITMRRLGPSPHVPDGSIFDWEIRFENFFVKPGWVDVQYGLRPLGGR